MASYRLVSACERITGGAHRALLPPAHLRFYYYRTMKPEAFAYACERARLELEIQGLRPEHRILDVGSGIGNLAVSLIGYLTGTYDGVEIHPEAVAWCRRKIARAHPNFRFHHANLASRAYNPRGAIPASEYRFPFPDRSFDMIFLASVFTHMLPDAVENYVGEISRLLAPGGVCVASYFLLNQETRTGVDRGDAFMSFDVPHASGLCRLHDADVPEAAVALDEGFVRRVHRDAGLAIRDIRRGRWWTGKADDQDVIVALLETPGNAATETSGGAARRARSWSGSTESPA